MSASFVNRPDPALPGWNLWTPNDDSLFNALIGPIHIRAVDTNRAEIRLEPAPRLRNIANAMHGGALLGFLDMAIFGGCGALDACHVGSSVTVEVNSHFLAAGRIGIPIIAEFEIMRSTRRLIFGRGVLRQEGEVILQYSAIVRKGSGPA